MISYSKSTMLGYMQKRDSWQCHTCSWNLWWGNSPRDTLRNSTYTTWAVPVTWVNYNCAHLPFHSTLQVQQMKPPCETRMRIWSPFAFLQPTTMATLHTSPCRWPHLPSPFPPFLLTQNSHTGTQSVLCSMMSANSAPVTKVLKLIPWIFPHA